MSAWPDEKLHAFCDLEARTFTWSALSLAQTRGNFPSLRELGGSVPVKSKSYKKDKEEIFLLH